MPGVKTCSKCGATLPATAEHFYRNGRGPDGLRSECKECTKAYRNRPDVRKRAREYMREYMREYSQREEYKQKKREYMRQYLQDPEVREQRCEYGRKWYRANRDRVQANVLRYQARKRKATGDYTPEDIQLIGDRQGWRCWYCQEDCKDNYHIEHRVPISRGGSNDPSNIVISCPTCNLSKRDKLPHEWCGRLI